MNQSFVVEFLDDLKLNRFDREISPGYFSKNSFYFLNVDYSTGLQSPRVEGETSGSCQD